MAAGLPRDRRRAPGGPPSQRGRRAAHERARRARPAGQGRVPASRSRSPTRKGRRRRGVRPADEACCSTTATIPRSPRTTRDDRPRARAARATRHRHRDRPLRVPDAVRHPPRSAGGAGRGTATACASTCRSAASGFPTSCAASASAPPTSRSSSAAFSERALTQPPYTDADRRPSAITPLSTDRVLRLGTVSPSFFGTSLESTELTTGSEQFAGQLEHHGRLVQRSSSSPPGHGDAHQRRGTGQRCSTWIRQLSAGCRARQPAPVRARSYVPEVRVVRARNARLGVYRGAASRPLPTGDRAPARADPAAAGRHAPGRLTSPRPSTCRAILRGDAVRDRRITGASAGIGRATACVSREAARPWSSARAAAGSPGAVAGEIETPAARRCPSPRTSPARRHASRWSARRSSASAASTS